METKTIIWISLSVVWVILFCLNLKVYFFQRTIHKIHMYTGMSMKSLGLLMPVYLQNLHLISMLRWLVVIALFFYNWIAALACLAIEFILPIILPEEDDYKNIGIIREELKRKGGIPEFDEILKDIMDKM